MSKINVLLVQFCPQKGDKKYNLNRVKKLIEESSQSNIDLILMPEFFNTGIGNQAFVDLAEEESNSETLNFFADIAREYNSNVLVGTIIEKDDDKLYNTSYFLDRNGNIAGKYRKIHLFKYFGGNEDECLSPGSDSVVIDTDIGKVGMAVCFDMRFPMLFHKLMRQGAELIVCPTAWAADWIDSLEICTQSLALQNACYLLSCTACGVASEYSLAGNSMIINPYGKVVNRLDDKESTLFQEIDLSVVRELRAGFPIDKIEYPYI